MTSTMLHWSLVAVLLAYCLSITLLLPSAASQVVVQTSFGKTVKGDRMHINYNNLKLGSAVVTHSYDQFIGISYAKPPTGERRFKATVSLDETDSAQDLSRYPQVCPQPSFHPDTHIRYQTEDCLYLNIYAPYEVDTPTARYPVMVYIHGGSYEVGSGTLYDGGVLAQKGAVVVTINYRLGALGFLSSGDSLLPGNYGLLDQIESLKWVRENIAYFRGDPERVTLFGHSVGASSVGILMVIPQARDLFHRVIAQSGAATASYGTHTNKITDFMEYVLDVGHLFSCTDFDKEAVVGCLRQVPAQKFITERAQFPLYDPIDPEFRPFVDGIVLPDVPRHLFKLGKFNRVPIIVGSVKDEFGNYFSGGVRHRNEFDMALDKYLVNMFKRVPSFLEVVKFQYTDWSENETSSFDYMRGDLLSDMQMIAPITEMADMISAFEEDIYQYHFSVPSSFHSVELNYVYGAPFSGHFADEMTMNGTVELFDEQDRQLSLRMMDMWIHFAKHGHPTSDRDTWAPYKQSTRGYIHFTPNKIGMKHQLRAENVAFWNNLVPAVLEDMIAMPSTTLPPPVNLWVLLAIVCFLVAIVFLLTALYVRSVKDKRRFSTGTTIYAPSRV